MNPAAMFLPAAFLLIFLSTLAFAALPPPVLDTHGEPVHSGTQYNVLPAYASHHGGYGGGLTLARIANHSESPCQLGVFQAGNPSSPGLRITFSQDAGDVSWPAAIPTATDINIQFAVSSTCVRSTIWKLGRFDQDEKKWFVLTGGLIVPGQRSPSQNLFKIVKVVVQGSHQIFFKIVFCPSACDECHGLCKDVGIFVDRKTGDRRLALVDHGPFLVQFRKV